LSQKIETASCPERVVEQTRIIADTAQGIQSGFVGVRPVDFYSAESRFGEERPYEDVIVFIILYEKHPELIVRIHQVCLNDYWPCAAGNPLSQASFRPGVVGPPANLATAFGVGRQGRSRDRHSNLWRRQRQDRS